MTSAILSDAIKLVVVLSFKAFILWLLFTQFGSQVFHLGPMSLGQSFALMLFVELLIN